MRALGRPAHPRKENTRQTQHHCPECKAVAGYSITGNARSFCASALEQQREEGSPAIAKDR